MNRGKVIGDTVYVHVDLLPMMESHTKSLAVAALHLCGQADGIANVYKIDHKARQVSLLEYPRFFDDAFPCLTRSWRVNLASGSVTYRTYEQSHNPPILHRKELLLPTSHPQASNFSRLTAQAEQLGLFENANTIGLKQQWEQRVRSSGYCVIGNSLQALGNDVSEEFAGLTEDSSSEIIIRHRTALHRQTLSAPIQALSRNGFLTGGVTLFDYGCGRGGDVAGLKEMNIEAQGWDPHFQPNAAKNRADIVNLGFVINVIEDIGERAEALINAFHLANKLLVVSVMLESDSRPPGDSYGDGVVTSRRTFQKYFSQLELVQFIDSVLDAEPILVAPGVAFVFSDCHSEQAFLATRTRNRRGIQNAKNRSVERTIRVKLLNQQSLFLDNRDTFTAAWNEVLELGRIPQRWEWKTELPKCSLTRFMQLLADNFDPGSLTVAAESRKADLTVYFALQAFSRRRSYSELEATLQQDVRHFFGSHQAAVLAGKALLHSVTDRQSIEESCARAGELGLGCYVPNEYLQIHVSLVEQLSPLLRVYIGCATSLFGDLREADLVKIHLKSSKVTFTRFDDFADKPLPLMMQRTKVNLRTQEVRVFDYGDEFAPPPLYFKSRFINEDCSELHYSDQHQFDSVLEALGLIPEDSFGPDLVSFMDDLRNRRMEISGFLIRGSTDIPGLDDLCGKHFTYRSFVECGSTMRDSTISNIPTEPDTYNALHQLTVNLLDPLVDYFGMIKLTYGFCSPRLARAIKIRIAPRLDQHASHELNSRGNRVCSRNGAACDFLVEDESMADVAIWIIENLPFDRLYYYGDSRPIHISYSKTPARKAWKMAATADGANLVPRPFKISEL